MQKDIADEKNNTVRNTALLAVALIIFRFVFRQQSRSFLRFTATKTDGARC